MALLLNTDEQTLNDIRIFGKKDGKGIFDIYNHCHTRGGEILLEGMFRQPLSDGEVIIRRCSTIAGFSKRQISFPYDASLLDMAEKYLASSNASGQHQRSPEQGALSEKETYNGVSAIIELIQATKRFVQSDSFSDNHAYEKEGQDIASLINDPVFVPVHKELQKGKVAYAAVTAYDTLFRMQGRGKIELLLKHIYLLDVYLSIAKVAADRKFVFPKVLNKGYCALLLEGLYHPELESPVSNNISMGARHNVIFLTGANMAGKSTFLRAISTALYIAHMGFPVAASRMEFSVMDGIYTTINLPDNLGIGASHFYAEVLRVKKIASELHQGKSLFVIFDELFRGTNVKDAHEATVAITGAFSRKKNSMFIISSHIVEAGEDMVQNNNVGFLYLPTRMNGHVPEYTYKLNQGITDDRHGMIIIRNEGILDILKNKRKEEKGKLNI